MYSIGGKGGPYWPGIKFFLYMFTACILLGLSAIPPLAIVTVPLIFLILLAVSSED